MYPRLHHQLIPNKVFLEPGFPPAVIESLERRGHRIDAQSVEKKVGSSVHVIYKNYKLKNMPTGLIEAEADPRKGGKPAGY